MTETDDGPPACARCGKSYWEHPTVKALCPMPQTHPTYQWSRAPAETRETDTRELCPPGPTIGEFFDRVNAETREPERVIDDVWGKLPPEAVARTSKENVRDVLRVLGMVRGADAGREP